jgi:hypothetical protein
MIAETANSIIDQALIQKEIGRENISVNEQETVAEVENVKRYYRLDDKGLKESLRGQGMDFDKFKEEVKNGLGIKKYLEARVFPPKLPESRKSSFYQRWLSDLSDKAEVKIFRSEISEALDNDTASACGGSCCS